jgi:hypothetical protein
MNNNKSGRRVLARPRFASRERLLYALALSFSLRAKHTFTHRAELWEGQKEIYCVRIKGRRAERQHQKISVRMCDQIELITLTCKASERERDGKEAPPGDGLRWGWGAARSPQRTPVQPAA